MNDLATAPRTGSAQMQGTLWNARARDYAEVMEGFFRPLYESALSRPELRERKLMSRYRLRSGTGGKGFHPEDRRCFWHRCDRRFRRDRARAVAGPGFPCR